WSLDACCLRHIYPSPPRPSAHSFPTRRSSDLSRPASVPSGKSHSSRSPRTGLYTAFALVPSSSTVQYSVTFEASRNRPCTSRSRSEEHTSELQSRFDLVCRLLLEKKNENSPNH